MNRIIFKCCQRKQYNLNTSTEARYCSSAQAVTLSKAPQTTPVPEPPTSCPPPPLKPKKKQAAPPKAPPKVPQAKLWDNPSYGYTDRDDPEMYEELNVEVSNEEEYGGEYECI